MGCVVPKGSVSDGAVMHLGTCSRDGLTNHWRFWCSVTAPCPSSLPPLATGLRGPFPVAFSGWRRAASGLTRERRDVAGRRAKQAPSCCPQGKGEPAFGRRRGPRTAAGGCACLSPPGVVRDFAPAPCSRLLSLAACFPRTSRSPPRSETIA